MMQKVKVTDEVRLIPAYGFPEAEEMPMFAENREHQRSSGNPYPARVVVKADRNPPRDRPFRIITIENQYIRVEIMPELGGRIYTALDKRTGYDFFYHQHVIKPALIGMLGSWISGGLEFNWPCHHRPSTFMPVDVKIEENPDGSAVVWMSENEPLNRMKGMVGISLRPGEAYFETKAQVYNGNPEKHSFLWWENTAVPVNRQYRLVFPPDVSHVQFHYRKNVTTYPVAHGVYNGISMGEATDISYHKNTPQPTSYFCGATKYEFFGGYDQGKKCGVIHVADRHISVGKKMFTWAYNQLAHSWETALTDTDGAYAELMASSYSLNQPDFAWLMPYESKEFSQLWYPVGDIGTPFCACREAALSVNDGGIKLQPSVALENACLTLNGVPHILTISPEEIVSIPMEGELSSFSLATSSGKILMDWQKEAAASPALLPETIPDNPSLDKLHSAQELYLLGVHVKQYRDPTASAEAYWREALRRDPEHLPTLIAMADEELSHYRVESAWNYAEKAWKVATVRNFHPESGELQYVRGKILEEKGDCNAAIDEYLQSAWCQDARSRAMTRAALLSLKIGKNDDAVKYAEEALISNAHNETALLAKIVGLKRTGSPLTAAAEEAMEKFDSMNITFRALKYGCTGSLYSGMGSDKCQSALDIAQSLWEMGENRLAADILANLPEVTVMTEYVRHFLENTPAPASEMRSLPIGVAYPIRPLEHRALEAALELCPEDSCAANLLGDMEYNACNYAKAAALWEESIACGTDSYIAFRNLAVAYYSHLGKKEEALPLIDKALALHPKDEQLVWEKAYVMLRLHKDPDDVAYFIRSSGFTRDDVSILLCQALNCAGKYDEALDVLASRQYTPCEGGEPAVAEQYMFAHHAKGRHFMEEGRWQEALEEFRLAQSLPDSLGAGLWNSVVLVPHKYFEAVCLNHLGINAEAESLLRSIISVKEDYFTDKYLPELPCWQAMALTETGRKAEARGILSIHMHKQENAAALQNPGYFGTTPFFVCYMEDEAALRQAAIAWQTALIHFACGNKNEAAKFAARALENNPGNLYAQLMLK